MITRGCGEKVSRKEKGNLYNYSLPDAEDIMFLSDSTDISPKKPNIKAKAYFSSVDAPLKVNETISVSTPVVEIAPPTPMASSEKMITSTTATKGLAARLQKAFRKSIRINAPLPR